VDRPPGRSRAQPRRAAATVRLRPRCARGGLAGTAAGPGARAGGRRCLGRHPGRGVYHRSQVPAGYAVTLEAAPADNLAPLLMRAWRLTRREREVARLVIDGPPQDDLRQDGRQPPPGHGRHPHRKNTRPGPYRPVIADEPGLPGVSARGPRVRTLNGIRRAPCTITTSARLAGPRVEAARPGSCPDTGSSATLPIPIRSPVTRHTAIDPARLRATQIGIRRSPIRAASLN